MMPPRAFPFIGLNIVRFLSIVSLILVFASTIFVMVTNIEAVNTFQAHQGNATNFLDNCEYIEGSTVPNQPAGVFWAVVSSLLIMFQTVVLILSEIGWPSVFFNRYFPVLGDGFGLGPLGIFQCLISTQILSHHVDDFTLVAAFLLFSIGCLNMLLGLIFRESAKAKRSITSWRAESMGILPTANDNRPVFTRGSPATAQRSFSMEKDRSDTEEFGAWKATEKPRYGFGRQGEKAAGLRGFILQKPEESLPRYASPTPRATVKRNHSTASSSSSFTSPYRESTQSLEYQDPPAADLSDPRHVRTPIFRSSPTAI
ncbi:hypothetical protein L208DRAFT_1422051 [Tricholoma matsutake]|nr:hypothetical protein L208DRAFT_1422051 [Tricholoma matsutake 945]